MSSREVRTPASILSLASIPARHLVRSLVNSRINQVPDRVKVVNGPSISRCGDLEESLIRADCLGSILKKMGGRDPMASSFEFNS
jgi:hypothetical protein